MKRHLVWKYVLLTRLWKWSIICVLFLISCDESEKEQQSYEDTFLSSLIFEQKIEESDVNEPDSLLRIQLSKKAQHDFDSLLTITKTTRQDTSRTAAYVELSRLFGSVNQNASYHYSQIAMRMCEEKLKTHLSKELKRNYLKSLAGSYNTLGYLHSIWGNLHDALEYHYKGLKISLEINDKKGTAQFYHEIGYTFYLHNDLTKALEYYEKSLKIRNELGILIDIGETLNNIGGIYLNENEFPIAKDFFLKSMKIRTKIDDQEGIGYCLNNLAVCFFYEGNHVKAMEYLQKSLEIRERIGDKKGIIESLNNIATNYIWFGDFDKALEYSLESLTLAKEYKMLKHIGDASEVLSYIYETEKNDSKNALKYYKQLIQMRDSVNNEITRRKAIEIHYDRELKIKEAVLKEKNKQERKLSQIKLSVVISVFVLTILFLLIWLYFFRKRKETEKLLLEKEVSLDTAEAERRRIAADLHDDLGAGIAALRLTAELLSQRTNTDEVMVEAAKVTAKVKGISERLREVIWEINIEHDNLEDLLLFIQKQGNAMFRETHVQFSMILPLHIPRIKINSANRRNIYFSVKELYTNIIRHSEASVARCEALIDQDLVLIISDNGKGFSESEIVVGEGLKNLSYRIEQMQGNIRTENMAEGGTKSFITIPLNHIL